MPIVSLGNQDLGTAVDTPKGFAVTPGKEEIDHGSDTPDFSSVVGSAFRQDNTVAAYLSTEGIPEHLEQDFNPWDGIKGTKYEPYFDSFTDIRNSIAMDRRKRQIDQELDDRKTLSAAPWYQSVPAQIAAGVIDLPTLLPGGAFVRGAKGGFSVARSALNVGVLAGFSSVVQEAALHNIEQTRSGMESGVNIGASVLLGGLLGAGGAKLLSKAEWNSSVASLNKSLDGLPPDSIAVPGVALPQGAGAAATSVTSLEDNTIAGVMAGAVAKGTKILNPALRLLQSPSPATREVGTQLFENSTYLKKNFDGVASEPAVETLMKEWNGGLAKAVTSTDEAFREHVKAGGKLSNLEFRAAVGKAMRRADEDENPFVAKVAKEWRKNVFDPLKQAAIDAKLLPEDVSVETAASYFSRMWNRNKLIAQEGKFKQIVNDYYGKVIEKEFAGSAEAHSRRLARLDQEIADLQLSGEQRFVEAKNVDDSLARLESNPDLMERLDRLDEIRQAATDATKAGDKKLASQLRKQVKDIEAEKDGELKTIIDLRSSLRARRRNIEYGVAGMEERSNVLLGRLADLEEQNYRSMERLIKKGQKLERDLDRLDADALEERVNQLAESYTKVAQRAAASAERAEKAVVNIKKLAERGAERNRTVAERAVTEAQFGPADEAAAKLATAKEAAEKTRAKRAAADEAARVRLEAEAVRQRALAERMDDLAERLRAAREFDHDGLMQEIRDGIVKAARETSASSLARGSRAAKIGERLQSVDPARVVERVKSLNKMRTELDQKFIERWEVGRGAFDVDPAAKTAKFNEVSRQISDEVFATLSGRVDSGSRPEFITIKSRGPMKERTFNIPDELVEEFLESDVDIVGRRYARIMGADVELARKFGSVDMADQLQKIREDYAKLRSGLADEGKLKTLAENEKSDISDLEALRDMLRGQQLYNVKAEQSFAKIARAANHFNYLRSMGEVVLASLTDAVRPAMVHGLGQFMETVPQLFKNMRGIKMSVSEAQLAGNVAERVLSHRLATITDIIDPYASRGPVEAFLENMTNVASRWNGIRVWTDAMKSVASVMTQNRIISNVNDFAKIKGSEKAYLAYLGIDESMAGRIAKQFSEFGETVDKVHVANTEKWTDAVAVRTYRAAMNKDVDSIIVQKSVADVPLFAQTPTGKMLLQFKSFALASNQRVLIRGLQEDQSRFVGGVIAMTAMGMFITWAKAVSGNRTERLSDISSNPGWWIAEGLDRSGVMAVPVEIANTFEKMTGVNPIKSPIKAFDQQSRISQKMQNRNELGSLLGPSFGTVSDAITVMGIPKTVASGEDIKQGQKNASERLLPFNSYLGIRQMMRYLVNPPD